MTPGAEVLALRYLDDEANEVKVRKTGAAMVREYLRSGDLLSAIGMQTIMEWLGSDGAEA